MNLGNFEDIENHAAWEEVAQEIFEGEEMPRRMVGSSHSTFVVETDKGELSFLENYLMSWLWDEMGTLTFQGAAKLGDQWSVFTSDQKGTTLTNQDGHTFVVHDVRIDDPNGNHLTFSTTLDYERFLAERRRHLATLSRLHSLDLTGMYEYFADDFLSSEEEDEEEEEGGGEAKKEEEVELEELDCEQAAQFMWAEIQGSCQERKLVEPIQEYIGKMQHAIQEEKWEEAMRLAGIIRPLFQRCPYLEEVHETKFRLDRKKLGVDLGHVRTFEDMQVLAKTHKYIRTHVIPPELFGKQREVAESRYNILYVSRRAYDQLHNVHTTLGQLVDQSQYMKEGQRVQVEYDQFRLDPQHYVPNRIVYHIRGFRNFDMKVEIW